MHTKRWISSLSLLVASLVLLGWYAVAHAAVGPLEASAGAALVPPTWLLYAGLALGGLAGVETMLKGISMILHLIAPHTATPLDDRAADRVDELHDKLDEFLAAARRILPAPAPGPGGMPGTLAKVGILVMFAGVTVAGGAVGLSCGGSPAVQQLKADGQAGKRAVLDCERKLAPAQLESALVMLAVDLAKYVLPGGGPDWGQLAALAIADASDVKVCALAEYQAVTAAPQAVTPGVSVQGVTVADPLALAVARVKAARGVGAIVTPGGTI